MKQHDFLGRSFGKDNDFTTEANKGEVPIPIQEEAYIFSAQEEPKVEEEAKSFDTDRHWLNTEDHLLGMSMAPLINIHA